MTAPIAAVTGATGFVGRRLIGVLAARGWRVRALVRDRPRIEPWDGAAPEVIAGDLADMAALERLADGADVLIHLAGLIKAARPADFFAVNRDGARAAAAAAQGRMVLVSSLVAREPALSDYAASKRAGEEAARAVAGARLTIVRPPAIYGPGDRETLALFRLAGASPILPLPGSARARLALAHVDDVAAVIATLATGPAPPGPFAIGGARPEGYSWREILTAAAAAMGGRPRLVGVPDWLVRGAAAVSQQIGRAGGRAAIFTPGKAREALHADWSVSRGETPPGPAAVCIGLEEGFAGAVAWYRAQGWLA